MARELSCNIVFSLGDRPMFLPGLLLCFNAILYKTLMRRREIEGEGKEELNVCSSTDHILEAREGSV